MKEQKTFVDKDLLADVKGGEKAVKIVEQLDAGAEEKTFELTPEILQKILVDGDVAALTSEERMNYYLHMCDKAGVDPAGRPFEFISFKDRKTGKTKMILYARKGCAEQLRRIHGISITDTKVTFNEKMVVCTCTARNALGRSESDVGAVVLAAGYTDLALMRAVTKAKRRVTFGICGLGDIEEAHPSEWVNREDKQNECRSKVLLEGEKAEINMNGKGEADVKVSDETKEHDRSSVQKSGEDAAGQQAELHGPGNDK